MSTPIPQHPSDAGVTDASRANPTHRRLIGLNIALLLILAVVTFASSSHAGAQPASGAGTPPGRGRGEYTMVAGRSQGSTTATIYILDASNQEVVAINWDRTNNRIEPIGFRSLNDDAKYLTKPR